MTTYYTHADGPLGRLLLVSDGAALTGLYVGDPPPRPGWVTDPGPFAQSVAELTAYFAGTLREFTVPVRPVGTAFQQAAWAELGRIPYGQTVSYAEQARRLGKPGAARAVGAANGKNPLCVVLPCHRVVAADGTLGGYSGGLNRKAWLLALEAGRG